MGRTDRSPASVAASAHVFVGDLEALDPDDDDRLHLARALRLRPGEVVTSSDGRGRWRRCRYRGERGGSFLEPDGPVVTEEVPAPLIGVAFALTKGARPEWIVQRCTEAGADRIIPMSAARSVVRWNPDQAAARTERLRKIAREAAMQSRRSRLPEIGEHARLPDLVGRPEQAGTEVMAERNGEPPSLERAFVLVGPEGGWEPDELSLGLPTMGLGPAVLRSETAAVAAMVLFSALRSGVIFAASTSRR